MLWAFSQGGVDYLQEVKLGLVRDGHLCAVIGNVVHLRLSQSMPSDVGNSSNSLCAGREAEDRAYVFG